jgi:hypothetical protein
MIITLVFEKNTNYFRRKLAKIAENCDHNIDPRSLIDKIYNFGVRQVSDASRLRPLPMLFWTSSDGRFLIFIFMLFKVTFN